MLALGALLVALAVPVSGAAARGSSARPQVVRETPAAREMARRCEADRYDEGATEACRDALALGIAEPRASAIRQLYAKRLVTMEKWDDLLALYRQDALERPTAAAHHRLGAVLLYAFGRSDEAVISLGEALRLDPSAALAQLDLALALASVGRGDEAAEHFQAASSLDPEVFALRPGALAISAAAREHQPWPPEPTPASPAPPR